MRLLRLTVRRRTVVYSGAEGVFGTSIRIRLQEMVNVIFFMVVMVRIVFLVGLVRI